MASAFPDSNWIHARQLAVMSSLVRFSHVAAETPYHRGLQAARGQASAYLLRNSSKRGALELWKLRAKGLIEKLPTLVVIGSSQRISYSVCCFQIFDKINAHSHGWPFCKSLSGAEP